MIQYLPFSSCYRRVMVRYGSRLVDTVSVTLISLLRRKYTDLAKAQTAFSNIIGEVWSKPKRMVRSASYTNLTYYKEAQHDYPIKVYGICGNRASAPFCRCTVEKSVCLFVGAVLGAATVLPAGGTHCAHRTRLQAVHLRLVFTL